jgi:uncharacterized iron-regulated protein
VLHQAHIIYLGETHDHAADHIAQLAIIKALYQQNPHLSIAMEMFQQPAQPALDRYLQGAISESELRAQTEYDQRWGFDWELYAPIVRFAKAQSIPILALNTPSEVTRQVARQGLASLSPAQRQLIPSLDEIRLVPPAYRQMVQQIYLDSHHGHQENDQNRFEFFFQAQVLWDETMAEGLAQALQQSDRQLVVLSGQGHVVYGYGIPSRVKRRFQGTHLTQIVVLLNPNLLPAAATDLAVADFLWAHRSGNGA